MNEIPILIAAFLALMVMAMVAWFCTNVPQGSMSFTFKPLGLHFEVKKGS